MGANLLRVKALVNTAPTGNALLWNVSGVRLLSYVPWIMLTLDLNCKVELGIPQPALYHGQD
jgi:hypothetical protein